MSKFRVLAIFVTLCMALSLLAACGGNQGAGDTGGPATAPAASPTGGAPAPAPSTGGAPSVAPIQPAVPAPENIEIAEHIVFVNGTSERVATFDNTNPVTSSIGSNITFTMIYDKLVEVQPDGTLIPELAKSWDINADYSEFTFHLRDDVYFHNGEKFTADDVAFTIERSRTAPGTQAYDRFSLVESWDIVNDYEIVLKLEQSFVDFVWNITWPACGIHNRKALEADPETGHYIGTGKYTVYDFVVDDYITFERFDNYWDDMIRSKYVTFRYVAEETARFIMLENGDANVVMAMSPIYVPDADANPNLDYLAYTLGNITYIGFNMNLPVMADINFRKAVAHAVNREQMVLAAREGYGTIPNNPVHWGYMTEFRNEDVARYDYDLDKAKEYLAMSSYNGETIEMIASNPSSQQVMQVAVSNLADIGINITARNTDNPGMNADTAWGNQDLRIHAHAGEYQFWASSARVNYYPGILGNRSMYDNPEVTSLLDEAMGTFDDAAREAIYRKIQEIVAEDCPYVAIYHHLQIIGISDGLGGILASPSTPFTDFSNMYLPIK